MNKDDVKSAFSASVIAGTDADIHARGDAGIACVFIRNADKQGVTSDLQISFFDAAPLERLRDLLNNDPVVAQFIEAQKLRAENAEQAPLIESL